ncbi:MAG: GYF domain-containing protein, partial [Bradymonadaceae bacterium]
MEAYFKDGSLDQQSYVWREGLEDWEQLSELEAFEHLGDGAAPDEETVVADPGQSPAAPVGQSGSQAPGGGDGLAGDMAGDMAGADDLGAGMGGEPGAGSDNESTVVTDGASDDRFD